MDGTILTLRKHIIRCTDGSDTHTAYLDRPVDPRHILDRNSMQALTLSVIGYPIVATIINPWSFHQRSYDLAFDAETFEFLHYDTDIRPVHRVLAIYLCGEYSSLSCRIPKEGLRPGKFDPSRVKVLKISKDEVQILIKSYL